MSFSLPDLLPLSITVGRFIRVAANVFCHFLASLCSKEEENEKKKENKKWKEGRKERRKEEEGSMEGERERKKEF